ncbi:hypothetical protein lbkm_3546 [Lachnospiraceae bacterium KM106-2]|nr:hypothetical protein lbkm_3546 [Lachnospiraceae bacterium KM106-2]
MVCGYEWKRRKELKMKLEFEKQQINNEIIRICNYASLKISYQILMLILAVMSVIQMLSSGTIVSFWLLIVGILLPLFVGRLFRGKQSMSQTFILSTLVEKYKYSDSKYHSLANSFLFEVLFLILWQYSNQRGVNENYIISILPSLMIIFTIIIRLGCYFAFWMLIKYKLRYNRL